MEINWLLLSNSCLEASKGTFKEDRARLYITCMLCQQYELEVKKFTVNGRLPIANGIRADGKDRLKSIVDHLQSSAHEEAIRLRENDEAWRSMSDSHPWERVMKKSKAETLNFLIHLAVDAYNDAQVETISARSWPSRSLAGEHSNHLVRLFSKEGWDSNFVPYNQPASLYHYRDPVTYGETQEIIGKLEMKHVADCLKDCLCYSVQIDGSTDKQQIDSKFVTARYVPVDEVCVKTVFLGISSSDLSGADGLLDSFLSCMGSVNCETSKLVGITTDGENANTGKNGGLWKQCRWR